MQFLMTFSEEKNLRIFGDSIRWYLDFAMGFNENMSDGHDERFPFYNGMHVYIYKYIVHESKCKS